MFQNDGVSRRGYPPIITVGQPGGRIFPVGPGMGATHATWDVKSPTRAAGIFPISTVAEPLAIIPGPPGTQPGRRHGVVVSITRAAGWLPIRTVGSPFMMVRGNAGCGAGVGVGPGGWIGAWQWGASWRTLSVIRAAGGIIKRPGQEKLFL